jgi:hypothetical protein
MPNGGQLGGMMDIVLGDRQYYVRPDGNDNNDGLMDSPSRAWVGLQHAVDVVAGLYNPYGYSLRINLSAGTHVIPDVGLHLKQGSSGNHAIIFWGAGAGSTILSFAENAGITAIYGYGYGVCWEFESLTISLAGTASYGFLAVADGAKVVIDNVTFTGRVTGGAVVSVEAATVDFVAFGISAPMTAPDFVKADHLSHVSFSSPLTITGTPSFTHFLWARGQSMIDANGFTYTGSATGIRALASVGGMIDKATASATYFPGSVAESADAASYGWIG